MAHPSNHGGKRPGAGRRSSAETHKEKLASFTDKAAGHLPQVYRNLEALADGLAEGNEETWEAAGTITRKAVARNPDGLVVQDKNGKPTIEDVQVFPHLAADELVRVGWKVKRPPPDFKANELFANRIGGTPRPAPELEADVLEIRAALATAVAAIAARKAKAAEEAAPPAPPTDADEFEPD